MTEADRFRHIHPERPTERELEVLQLIANGLGNARVAKELGIGPETVKTHLRRILPKLEAANRTHAVAIALREAFIE